MRPSAFVPITTPTLFSSPPRVREGEAAEFISRLREQPDGAEVPVIVVGSEEDFDCIERAREAGAGDHLLIPVDHRDFRIRARSQLLRQRGPRGAGAEIAPVDERPVEEPASERPARPTGATPRGRGRPTRRCCG